MFKEIITKATISYQFSERRKIAMKLLIFHSTQTDNMKKENYLIRVTPKLSQISTNQFGFSLILYTTYFKNPTTTLDVVRQIASIKYKVYYILP